MENIQAIHIPESLHQKLKEIAHRRGIFLKALVVEILTKEVSK